MIRALQLIFSPTETWQKIELARRGVLWVFFLSLLPLMVLSGLAEGYALLRWGGRTGELDRQTTISLDLALRYELAQLVLGQVMLFVGAKFVQWIADGFHLKINYTACFTATAYTLSPIFLLRFLDSYPGINTWVCWAIGVLLAVSVLYHGVGPVLKPDQTKGFGFFLLLTMFLVLITGLSHFVALAVLDQKVKF